MRHQFVTNNPAIDVEVLQVRLAARECWQTYPAPKPQTRGLDINIYSMFQKCRPADQPDAPLLLLHGLRRLQLMHCALIVT